MRFVDGYPLVSSVSPLPTASGEMVGKDSAKFRKLSAKSGGFSGEALERLVAFLLRLHPHKTAEAVEAFTLGAVKADRVRKWLGLQCAPDFVALLHLIRAYGAEFLVVVIGDAPESLLEAAIAQKRMRYLEKLKKLEEEVEALRR